MRTLHTFGAYPPDWSAIAKRVKQEAGWKCIRCGHPNHLESGHVQRQIYGENMAKQAAAMEQPPPSTLLARQQAAFAAQGVAPPAGPLSSPSPKRPKGRRVARTRNAGAWTEAQYWQSVRSGLRRLFRFWKPALAALHAARVRYPGRHGAKWAYLCADCKKLFRRQGVEIDHVEPVGTLTDLAHVADFLRRLTPEDPKAYAVRCLRCHQAKTGGEAAARRVSPSASARK